MRHQPASFLAKRSFKPAWTSANPVIFVVKEIYDSPPAPQNSLELHH
jgi:hypothetical protein